MPSMHAPPPVSPASLADWLVVATKNLVPSAQARVRGEIKAHFAEAASAHQKNGQSEVEATSAALADLGSARAAGRRYRREYLTHHDAMAIGSLHKRSSRSHFACCIFLLLINLSGYFQHPQVNFAGLVGLCVLMGMSVPDISLGRVNPSRFILIDPQPEHTRQILWRHFLVNSLALLSILIACGFYHPLPHDPLSTGLPVLMIAVLVFAEYWLFRLCQKLQIFHPGRRPPIFGRTASY